MRTKLAITIVVLFFAPFVHAQLAEQSTLTKSDVDPHFALTLEHLAQDSRAFGLSPRDIAWSPGGESVFFRWRKDPASGQSPQSDPWFSVDRNGARIDAVDDANVALIPPPRPSWSRQRDLAAWSRGGNLVVWTEEAGSRVVFTTAPDLGRVHVAPDGTRVFFSTEGFQFRSEDDGDLWSWDRATGHTRLIAEVVTKDEELSEQKAWLEEQQRELIAVVKKRKDRSTEDDGTRRRRQAHHPQEIPIEEGERAFDLKLSSDGRFVTFLWTKAPPPSQTDFMEFVNESGYATNKKARPKVGEALAEYKFGVVAMDANVVRDEIEVRFIDDGIEKETIIHGPFWSPTGKHAALQILSMDHKERWISLLDIETGTIEHIDHQDEEAWIGGPLVEGRWRPGFLSWLPDGTAFGFGSVETGWAMLYLAELGAEDSDEPSVRQLTHGEWEVRSASLSPDGTTWHLTTSREHPGEEQFYHLPARGGEMTRITQREGKARGLASPDGARLAVRFESPGELADLYLQENTAGSEPKRITKSGTDDFYRYDWIESEIIHFPDAQGLTTWAKVWERPERANNAAVVYAHGCGECAQAVDKGWSRLGSILYANYLYQKGYVSASIDYRGSSGYGHANRTYAYRQMGVSDIDSGLPLLDILSDKHGVDRRRIGVYGGSYGGFFTLMSLFRHPGAYAAGVALYPVTDWAHYNQGYTSRILNGTPLTDPEAYRRSSPMYYADGLEDALQIQHGLVDNNVQIQDSFRLAQVLMEKKKDFDLVVYPMEDHGWDEVPSRLDSYKRMTRWFDRFLLGADAEATTENDR